MLADLVLTNGRIVTMNDRQPEVTAVAIRYNQVLAIGNDAEIRDIKAQDGEWIDLNGRTVVPGLVDAHVHFEGFALSRRRVNLDEAD
ncbi:MAG: hypothetical protein R3293_14335, partial [Candidatus Promineifilaceae bacterium]|nr:hypothetical protein [Candidatus Promineifilaceae bacterium]